MKDQTNIPGQLVFNFMRGTTFIHVRRRSNRYIVTIDAPWHPDLHPRGDACAKPLTTEFSTAREAHQFARDAERYFANSTA